MMFYFSGSHAVPIVVRASLVIGRCPGPVGGHVVCDERRVRAYSVEREHAEEHAQRGRLPSHQGRELSKQVQYCCVFWIFP